MSSLFSIHQRILFLLDRLVADGRIPLKEVLVRTEKICNKFCYVVVKFFESRGYRNFCRIILRAFQEFTSKKEELFPGESSGSKFTARDAIQRSEKALESLRGSVKGTNIFKAIRSIYQSLYDCWRIHCHAVEISEFQIC